MNAIKNIDNRGIFSISLNYDTLHKKDRPDKVQFRSISGPCQA